MSENKIKALEEKGEKLESNIDSNREQINANLEAICWIRKLVLKLNKQKIFFWQLKKEISELEKRYESHSHPQVEKKISELNKGVLFNRNLHFRNRRILRELIEALVMLELISRTFGTSLLAKLEGKAKEAGSARQTEENEAEWDCPICNKGVMIGHFLHKHCWDDLKADLEWLFANTNPTNYAGRRQKYHELREKYLREIEET